MVSDIQKGESPRVMPLRSILRCYGYAANLRLLPSSEILHKSIEREQKRMQRVLEARGEVLSDYPISHAMNALLLAHQFEISGQTENLNTKMKSIYKAISEAVELDDALMVAQECIEVMAREIFAFEYFFLKELSFFPPKPGREKGKILVEAIYALHYGSGKVP